VYDPIYVTRLENGMYQIANGHHRVAALRRLGYDVVKAFITK
jgi:ParB-like chromosome segregation protein Spo0J